MTDLQDLLTTVDAGRRRGGFLSVAETLALAQSANIVYDPFSALISRDAVIGERNVIHPNVRLECREGAELRIGSDNVFCSNTAIEATTGRIAIGSGNYFGEGAVCIKANAPAAEIVIGDGGRYIGCLNIFGRVALGNGSQVLGSITLQDCSLAAGQPYSHPRPDERGAVLKGAGLARNITLLRGQVIDAWGRAHPEDAVLQSTFHPDPATPRPNSA